jgi:hypothetical protein
MTRAVIIDSHQGLNQFPAKNGVSQTMSPLTIMTGKPSPDYNDLKLELGSYVQVFEDNDPTNTMKTRTTGAIALTQTGNAQGGYYFMSLTTGRRVSRQQWDVLPMPDGVIAAVENMALEEDQPLIGGRGAPFFEWSPGIPIEDHGVQAPVLDEQEDEESDEGSQDQETASEGEEEEGTDDSDATEEEDSEEEEEEEHDTSDEDGFIAGTSNDEEEQNASEDDESDTIDAPPFDNQPDDEDQRSESDQRSENPSEDGEVLVEDVTDEEADEGEEDQLPPPRHGHNLRGN